MHFLWDIGQDLAASAVRSSLYQYPRGNYNWVCTKVNLKYDFHITGQLMENHPEYSGITYLSFKPCCDKLKDSLRDTLLSNPEYHPTKEEAIIIDTIEIQEM